MPRGRRGSYTADQGLIQGARDIAQANTYGNKLISDAYGQFGESFNKNFKIIKDEFDKKQKVFDDKMNLIDDQIGDITQLSEDQTNQYTSFFLNKKREYAEIIGQLEDKTLSFEDRSALKFQANSILSSARNSAQQLQSRNGQIAELRDNLSNDRFSNSNFFTDPDKAAKAHDYAFKGYFSIDGKGNIDGDINYNMKATAQAEEFIAMNGKLRDAATKYGIHRQDDFYEDAKRNYNSRLDDSEVLSFMFDDLSSNNGGYFDAIISKQPLRTDEFVKYRDMLSDESTRDEAIKFFKKEVVNELDKGLRNNIKNGIEEYNVKNPQTSSATTGSRSAADEKTQRQQKFIYQTVDEAYNDAYAIRGKDGGFGSKKEEYESIADYINQGLTSLDNELELVYDDSSQTFTLFKGDGEKGYRLRSNIDPNDKEMLMTIFGGGAFGDDNEKTMSQVEDYNEKDYSISFAGGGVDKVKIRGLIYTKEDILNSIKNGKLSRINPDLKGTRVGKREESGIDIDKNSPIYKQLLRMTFLNEADIKFLK